MSSQCRIELAKIELEKFKIQAEQSELERGKELERFKIQMQTELEREKMNAQVEKEIRQSEIVRAQLEVEWENLKMKDLEMRFELVKAGISKAAINGPLDHINSSTQYLENERVNKSTEISESLIYFNDDQGSNVMIEVQTCRNKINEDFRMRCK